MTPEELQKLIALRQAPYMPSQIPSTPDPTVTGTASQAPYMPSQIPSTLDPAKLQQLVAIRQAQMAPDTPDPQELDPAAPTPPVVPPPENPADPYSKAAAGYTQKATDLETSAAKPMPTPHGFKENLVDAARAAMENFGRFGAPGGSYGQDAERQAQFTAGQTRQLAQAKEFHGLADVQQKMGETATADQARIEEVKRLRAETERKNTADEAWKLDPRNPANTKTEFAPAGSQPFVNGVASGPAIPKDTPPKQLESQVILNPTTHKPERWAVDMSDPKGGRLVNKLGDAPENTSGTSALAVEQGTDANGQPAFFIVNKAAGTAAPVHQASGDVLAPKRAEAPQQMKNQANAAKSTKDQIGVVRQVMKDHPELTGPAIGRAAEVMLRFGGDPSGMLAYANGQPDGYEKNTALLAAHLTYLFMNEARATSPGGRIPQNMLELIKSRSAAITQNPQVIEGFLQAAENNANIQLKNAAAAHYDPFNIGAAAPQSGGTPQAQPAVAGQNLKRTNKATGEVQFSSDGGKTWHK